MLSFCFTFEFSQGHVIPSSRLVRTEPERFHKAKGDQLLKPRHARLSHACDFDRHSPGPNSVSLPHFTAGNLRNTRDRTHLASAFPLAAVTNCHKRVAGHNTPLFSCESRGLGERLEVYHQAGILKKVVNNGLVDSLP